MRILFDKGTPRPLRRHSHSGHDRRNAAPRARLGRRLSNGDIAGPGRERPGFEVLITTDQGIRYQQNIVEPAGDRGSPDEHRFVAAHSPEDERRPSSQALVRGYSPAKLREVASPNATRVRHSVTTDTSEGGLERLICVALTGRDCDPAGGRDGRAAGGLRRGLDMRRPAGLRPGVLRGPGAARDIPARDAARDRGLAAPGRGRCQTRRRFLARLQGEITKRGTIDVLRKGIKRGPHHIDLFYGTPSRGNERARLLNRQNRFSVTRQLRYSRDETQLSLDLGLFINGLPVATFELKNSLTKQTVDDAVEQYKRDRSPREKLFELGRCLAHFAVDDHEVQFCTQLKGKASWFLPFNRGWNDGAGNPPNPNGLKTDYLWKQVLTRDGLTDIIENYAQIVESKDAKTGRKKRDQIWPRYHQLDVVRKLLADASSRGVGHKYLIQHSAGSGKSNSIAWLAHQLIGLEPEGQTLFDSVIVVTDRKVLDKQIRDTIKQFAQVGSVVGHAERSHRLRRLLQEGKRIIITTVQKFPHILDAIGNEHRARTFAIIIDEAHSSQAGGRRRRCPWRWDRRARRRKRRPPRTRSTGSWRARSCCPMRVTSPSPRRPRTRRWRSSARPFPTASTPGTRPSTPTP